MGMGIRSAMGWEWDRNGIKVCGKWELRCGSGKKSLHTVSSKHLQKALIAFKFILHAIIVQQYYLVVFLCKLTFIFWVLSFHLIAISFAFFNLANTVAWGSVQACRPQKKLFITTVMSRLSCKMGMGMGEVGIDRWEKWEWDLSFRREWDGMGMGMESLKWEGIGTKNLFPHISTAKLVNFEHLKASIPIPSPVRKKFGMRNQGK